MVSIRSIKKFCKGDYTKIENYEKAIADSTQTWHLHHKDECKTLPSGIKVIRTREEMIENGRYFNCPANELIFLTKSDHTRLHMSYQMLGNTIAKENLTGRKFSKEHKEKLSMAQKEAWSQSNRKSRKFKEYTQYK